MPIFFHKSFIISFLLLLLFFAFIIFLGEDASIRVHDNLEANIAWYKSLADQHLLFASSYTPNETVMKAPRIAFGSEWSLIAWLFVWFKPIVAYNINVILMSLVAFVGTHLFTKNTLKLSPKIAPFVALGFALLPFWFSGGLSSAGQPLLFWSFDRILKKHNSAIDWIIFILFPFYSSLILSGLFMMVLMIGYFGMNFLKKESKVAYGAGILSLFILTIGYILVDYRLFLDILKIGTPAGFIPHRVEFMQGNTFSECLKATKNSFLGGQNHFPSFHTYLILPLVCFYIFYGFVKQKKLVTIVLCLIILGIIAIIDGFWNFAGFETLKDKLPILKAIQFDRFYSLYPILWFGVFVLIIRELSKKIAIALASIQVVIVLFSNQLVGDYIKKTTTGREYVSYREFYAEDLFSKVKTVMKRDKNPNKRVGMVGLHPAIAQYNQIPTIDGYAVLYSLAYKHQIQAIIQPELNQNKFIKNYFEHWGSRCYLFDNEAVISGDGILKKQKCCTEKLDYNFEKLKQLKCGYILSAIEVKHPSEHLKLLSMVEDTNWRVWIYKIL
jgi:hypothetical protein